MVSEVHAQYPQDPHFQSLSGIPQTPNFNMGRTSTPQYDSNAPKIITVGAVDPEIVRSELWQRNLRGVTHSH